MDRKRSWVIAIAGVAAGLINGLMGAGGGMILVPILAQSGMVNEAELFSSSLAVMLPISCITLLFSGQWNVLNEAALPYCMVGGVLGAAVSVTVGRKIPVKWLHRIFGLLLVIGGIRVLC